MFRALTLALVLLTTACGGGGTTSSAAGPVGTENPGDQAGSSDQAPTGDQAGTGDAQPGEVTAPSMGHDHCGMVPALADLSLVTATATQSGRWTNPDTWGGALPVDGDVVQVPAGVEVILAEALNSRLETVRIDGALRFSAARDTLLQVDTLVTTCTGELEIGTEVSPIQADVSAKIVFIDDGPVSDANLIGRGALLMGQTTIHGAAKTHRAVISPHARQGDSELTLTTVPAGWQPGDQLIITGTTPNDPSE